MNYGFAFFPGQGAQHPGMGQSLYESCPASRKVFDLASEVAGIDVAKLCIEGTQEELSRTVNSQIAIFTHSIAAYAALYEAGVAFSACAGFSLGEYTALTASGVVSMEDGVKIVCKRGQLMQQAADEIDSGMAAIVGLEDEIIEKVCTQVTCGLVRPVNYNCPGQLVIAGEKDALNEAIEKCKDAGARRALPLAVSGAFHTPLMAKAAAELRQFANQIEHHNPKIPIYTNVSGDLLKVTDLPTHLETHMVSPVRWKTLVENGLAVGLTSGCEIGPGKTLTNFAKKIDKKMTVFAVETIENIESVVKYKDTFD